MGGAIHFHASCTASHLLTLGCAADTPPLFWLAYISDGGSYSGLVPFILLPGSLPLLIVSRLRMGFLATSLQLLDMDSSTDTLSSASSQAFGSRMSPQTSTHIPSEDKEISVFVQDIDDRKPLSGRTKERLDRQQTLQAADFTSAALKGKGRAYDAPGLAGSPLEGPSSPLSPLSGNRLVTSPDAMSPPAAQPPTAAETAHLLSTSPQRGPMLTSEQEIDERLRHMNEAFQRSLEGIGEGSVRRKKTREALANAASTAASEQDASRTGQAAPATTDSHRNGSQRSTSGSSATATATASVSTAAPPSPTAPAPPRSPGPAPLAIPAGMRLGTTFPSRGALADRGDANTPPYATPGLGLGLPARARRTSTSSSMMGASEVGASQGSEEVIGRLELDGERRRWGYGFAPP